MGRILVCEDSSFQANNVKTILETAGHEVILAENGQVGLSLLEGSAFDLVLSDIQMPEVTGFDLCRQIRQQPQYAKLPIVLMTTLTEMEHMRKGQDVGANMYIVKPFEAGELLRRVSKFVSAVRGEGGGASVSRSETKPGIVVLRELLTKAQSLAEQSLSQSKAKGLTDLLNELKETLDKAMSVCGVGAADPSPPPSSKGEGATAQGQLLLVQPNESLRNVMQSNLEKQGYTVHSASAASAAVTACKTHGDALDVVVTEAVECSSDLLKAIKKACPKAVLLCLVEGEAKEGDTPILPDDVAVLKRPFTVNALVARVKELQAKS